MAVEVDWVAGRRERDVRIAGCQSLATRTRAERIVDGLSVRWLVPRCRRRGDRARPDAKRDRVRSTGTSAAKGGVHLAIQLGEHLPVRLGVAGVELRENA
jgi:hypothetical protein